MKQLLICDFDGTLYRKGEERQFKRILEFIRSQKIPLAVASGRPWHMLRPYFEEMLHDVFLISNDGALITLGEQVLYSRSIEKEMLADFCAGMDCDYVAYGRLTSYMKIKGLADQIKWRQTFRQHAVKIKSIAEIEEPIYKIFFLDKMNCPDFLVPTYGQFGILEFAAQGTNKAAALSWLTQTMKIPPEQCWAFGDGANDICLFDLAGHSAAMEQASPKVKHRADRICTNLYEDIATIFQRGDC